MDWYKKRHRPLKQVVFSIDDNNIYLAVNKGNELLIIDQVLLESINAEAITNAVSSLAEKHSLIGLSCTLVLPEQRYQLLMTDPLNVPEPKMAQALRWNMKGLLELPVNDVALDVFFVPPHGTGEQRKKVFVVAVAKAFIQICLDAFEKSLIPIKKVDIGLFSLRNLIIAASPIKQTQLLINLSENQCLLTIFHDQHVYLVRKLNVGSLNMDESLDESLFDKIELEIQRSIDYCLSELKLPAPNQIVFDPSFLLHEPLLEYLKKHLSQKICCLDLNNTISGSIELTPQKQKSHYLCIGNAIGVESIKVNKNKEEI